MKRFFNCMALLLISMMIVAQDIPVGMRMEVIEISQGDDEEFQYSIFQYKEENGNTGYYLSLIHSIELMGIIRGDLARSSLSHYDEVCLPMGATREEAQEKIESISELLNKAPGSTFEFPCRINNGADRLGQESTTTCTVAKRFLRGKLLVFSFESGSRNAQAELSKSALKQLRFGLKLDKKIHPGKKADIDD
ncbi:MAG: hypothetical protein J6W42_07565 [Bacteroidaceae bacterium]|nr:hypothetical protein [Bacteroidaceae bacterium]